MKQKKIGDKLYVFSETPYVITEDTDADVIIIQLECLDGFAELNSDLVDKMVPYNYHMFTVKSQEWSDYYDDYTITVASVTGGTLTATPLSADLGEEVTLSNTPDTGYEFTSYNVTCGGEPVTVTDNKFTMPLGDVIVSGTFTRIYNITVATPKGSGTTVVNLQTAHVGDTVTITSTPESGYKADALYVTDGTNSIPVTSNQFTMPAGDVTVKSIYNPITTSTSDYFTIQSLEDGNEFTYGYEEDTNTYVSSDGGSTWNEAVSYVSTPLSMNFGDELMVKTNTDRGTYNRSALSARSLKFILTKTYKAKGNIMSLLYTQFNNSSLVDTTNDEAFYKLFKGDTKLVDAGDLLLPSMTLTRECYRAMFQGCTALVNAPVLPATTLVYNCYNWMFNGCTSLSNITMLATTIGEASLSNWVADVAAEGTFTKNAAMTNLPTGTNGIPTGWTVVDYTE